MAYKKHLCDFPQFSQEYIHMSNNVIFFGSRNTGFVNWHGFQELNLGPVRAGAVSALNCWASLHPCVCACVPTVFMCTTCMQEPTKIRRECWISWNWGYISVCESPLGCWELNLGSTEVTYTKTIFTEDVLLKSYDELPDSLHCGRLIFVRFEIATWR